MPLGGSDLPQRGTCKLPASLHCASCRRSADHAVWGAAPTSAGAHVPSGWQSASSMGRSLQRYPCRTEPRVKPPSSPASPPLPPHPACPPPQRKKRLTRAPWWILFWRSAGRGQGCQCCLLRRLLPFLPVTTEHLRLGRRVTTKQADCSRQQQH